MLFILDHFAPGELSKYTGLKSIKKERTGPHNHNYKKNSLQVLNDMQIVIGNKLTNYNIKYINLILLIELNEAVIVNL